MFFCKHFYVPEVLNVHMNEIDRKLTTIKLNKSKFKKSHFLFQILIFNCLKKIILKKVDFFIIFVPMNVRNFRHIKFLL